MMLDKFNAFIEEHKLCRKSDNLLLAVSGGVDSMVMTDLFYRSGYSFTILHCNFKLRDKASDEDEKFVIKVAERYEVEAKTTSFNTSQYAIKNKLSIQVAARELRYNWFNKFLVNDVDKLATAHHLNDQLETVLYHLSKGAGIEGIAGIPIKQEKIIRPLLNFSKEEMMNYALENKLEWREDVSNESLKYKRNFIRHKIVPLMEEINPSLINTFQRTSKRLKEAEKIIESTVDQFKKKYLKKEKEHLVIRKDVLKDQNATFIQLLFKDYGIKYTQAEDVLSYLQTDQSGGLFLTDGYTLNIDREYIYISNSANYASEFMVPEAFEGRAYDFHFKLMDAEGVTIEKLPEMAFLDYSRLRFPLKIRKWQEGDKFQPLGMKGQKKLSDFMIDNKIPVNLKNRMLVLESEGDIVWVVGHRIDERYKVTSGTTLIYNIKWLS
ncbi:MAG: tRNA lysidine(34) synthetase TilS [Candidatus Cyclobacteriaceae bacterium M2_1C_046]